MNTGKNTEFQAGPAAERVKTALWYFGGLFWVFLIRPVGCPYKSRLSSIYKQLVLMVDFNKKTGFLTFSMSAML